MKKALCGLFALFALTGCAVRLKTNAYDPQTTTDALLASSAFEQKLDTIKVEMAQPFYGISIVPDEATIYSSMEGGYEGMAVLLFENVEDATLVKGELGTYLEATIANESKVQYKPEDVPKLKEAQLHQAEHSLLLVIANDYDEVNRVMEELGYE